MVLESWCYTRKGFQRYSRRIAAQLQGIPSGVTLSTNSPEGGKGGAGGLELHQTLEWVWSWRPGVTPGRVVQEWSTWRRLDSREFPNCVARYKFPRRRRRLDLYQQQQGSLIPAGLRHLYQGSVGDGKRWITGIQGSHGVIDLFVYTSSILVSCLYRHLILTVYTRRVILITPMPLRR